MRFRRALASVCSVALLGAVMNPGVAQSQQAQPSATEVTPDPWPRTFNVGGARYMLYQPQLKSWDGQSLQTFARGAGDQRSAASSWGSSGWGDGFNRSSSSGFGGGGWDRGGGGWDRGGFGADGFGGGRSWGGGSFGGGRFGGGFRR